MKIDFNYFPKAQVSFLTPFKLGNFSPDESVSVAAKLSEENTKLTQIMAKSLGAKIPITENVASIASIASSIPLQCFNITSPATLASLVNKMDLDNMDPFRKGFIAFQVRLKLNKSS